MNNNRFKFRVWDKKNSEYVPDGETCDVHCLLWRDGTLDCGISYDDGFAGGIDWVKREDAIIEQCTGLKDKHGKLIYENDVVRFYWTEQAPQEFIVKWNNHRCCFDFYVYKNHKRGCKFGQWYWCFDSGECKYCEIISNIHEKESENE